MKQWYSVRSIFEWDRGVFEERVTLWQATSLDQAITYAEREALTYSSGDQVHDIVFVGLLQAYEIGEAQPTSGTELFSLLRDSGLSKHEYVSRFFDTGSEHQQR